MRLALRLILPGAIAALTLVACAGNANAPAASTGAAPAATVSMKGFAFAPTALTVAKGTTVTFTNGDAAAHTVTSGANGTKDGKFDRQVAAGASTTVTFDTAGTFDYFCTIHASMKGTITVQ